MCVLLCLLWWGNSVRRRHSFLLRRFEHAALFELPTLDERVRQLEQVVKAMLLVTGHTTTTTSMADEDGRP